MHRSALLIALLLLGGCKSQPAAAAADASVAAAKPSALAADAGGCVEPRMKAIAMTTPLTIDGELDEVDWRSTDSSKAFTALHTGAFASPHSELRAVWSPKALVLGLYAADEDLRDDDMFVVRVQGAKGAITFRVTARGALSRVGGELPSGARAAVDADGTFGDDSDYDEEWLVELELPWAALGFEKPPAEVKVNAWRSDTPKGAQPRTTAWACAGEDAFGTITLAR